VQYDGGVLNDNGRVCGAYIGTCQPPVGKYQHYCSISGDTGTLPVTGSTTTRQGVTAVKNAYDGQMPKGAYGVWKPQKTSDIMFKLMNEQWCWQGPYTCIIMYNPTAAGQQLRVRVVWNWEMLTESNQYDLSASPSDPAAMALAFNRLANFPLVQENTIHWQAIKDFVQQAYKDVGTPLRKMTKRLTGGNANAEDAWEIADGIFGRKTGGK